MMVLKRGAMKDMMSLGVRIRVFNCGILGELSHDALIRKANAISLAERPPELALLPSLHTLDSKQDHHRRTIPPITATVNIWFV